VDLSYGGSDTLVRHSLGVGGKAVISFIKLLSLTPSPLIRVEYFQLTPIRCRR